jgi:hypothetical protein
MILKLLRVPLTIAFVYTFVKLSTRNSELSGGDIILVLAYGLFGAIAIAILWAPVIGEKISDPLTSTLTSETSLPAAPNLLVQWITWLQRKGYHRLALVLVFVEGVRHPTLPQPALLGLRSVRPGSFLERCFAREVYHYNNIQNCLHAYKILKERHGVSLPLHKHPEVNLAIMGMNREPHPEPARLQVKPSQSTQPPQRNERIKLFRPS